ncbi:resolvase domain protein [Hydrogenobacter thermophilus TK-6]|uniref:Resolvase domain protein n=1 Tax=Hydrogenobacter thermophilus (strain DSM 6534 / IAM 12695 / TK-6) TaxID=608538 RepID=D3DGM6_HYDTT|nr:resolvase domain protein [Hydrogenobacter thermophilus TK-6]
MSLRGIVYARVSTDKQAERETPIESQISQCLKYAQEKGIEVVAIFKDEGISGSTDKRPQFQQAISYAVKNNVDCFIVFDTSRFARNREDAIYYKRLLRKNGIELHYVVTPLPDDPVSSYLTEGIFELLDEYYTLMIKKHTLRGIEESIKKRIYPKNKCPVGYKVVKGEDGKGRIYKDEETSHIYLKILTLFRRGLGALEIAHYLNRELGTDEWNKKKILRVLKNPLYKGIIEYGEIKVYFEDLRYISDEEWGKIQKELQRRHKEEKGRHKAKMFFVGLLKCGRCGSAMTTRTGKGKGGLYFYYVCYNRLHRKCKQEILPAHKVDEFLSKEILDYILNEQTLQELTARLKETIQKASNNFLEREKELREEKEKIENQINNLIKAITAGIDPHTVKDELNRLQAIKDKISAELSHIKNLKTLNVAPRINPAQVRAVFEELVASNDYRRIRSFFKTLIKEIVYDNKTFDIQYSPALFVIEGNQGRVTGLEPATRGSTVHCSTS